MSSISSTSSSGFSTDTSRISGMVSGMDTESIVEGLVISYQEKVDSLKQDKQDLVWKQEAYEEVMGDINSFMDDFYDVLKPESNILSSSGMKTASIYSNLASPLRYVEILANSDAPSGSHTIDRIEQVATSSSLESSSALSGSIKGDVDLSLLTPAELTSAVEGKTFSITLDGVLREINIDTTDAADGTLDTSQELVDHLNSKFDSQFGPGRILASMDGNNLSLSADNSVIQVISGTENDFLAAVGMENSARNTLDLDGSLSSVFGEIEEVSFDIKGVSFTFANTTSLRDIMDEVNRSDAGVKMSYSTISDTIRMESRDTGASSYIDITNNTGSLFGASSHIGVGTGKTQNGQDARIYLDGSPTAYTRSSNTFTIDGTTFNVKEATEEDIEYRIENNTEEMLEKIVSFVDEFNDLYSGLKDKLSEKVELDYDPLKEAQKEEMSDKEIELWEEKAKSGMLRNDSILNSLTSAMRSALYDAIDGTNLTFKDIGIEDSKDYSKFELVIDENKLRTALADNPEDVMELFNKEEDISYSATLSAADKSARYDEVGFAQRVQDILKGAVRTTRDSNGYKGSLVEKVGLDGDTSEVTNLMKSKLEDVDDKIEKAIDNMQAKEEYYWDQFTYMETVISQLNAQSESLYGFLMG